MKRLKTRQQQAVNRAAQLARETDRQDPAEMILALRLIAKLAEKVLPPEVLNGAVIPQDLREPEATCYWVWRLAQVVDGLEPDALTTALKTIAEAANGNR